jgi:hypothetical protein
MIEEEARPSIELPDRLYISWVNSKLNMSKFSAIRSFRTDLGMTTMSRCVYHLRMTCATVLPNRCSLILMLAAEKTIRRNSRIIGRSCKSGYVDLPLGHNEANINL